MTGTHRRFFVEADTVRGAEATLTGPLAHQIAHVLRLGSGDEITLLDGSGDETTARITSVSKYAVRADLADRKPCPREPKVKLTLAVCLPKRDKVESIIQHCTELGVSRFVIVQSERSVPRLEDSRRAARLQRWQRVAKESAEQCGRARIPEITAVVLVSDLAAFVPDHRPTFVACEHETSVSLRDALLANADISEYPCPEASVMLIIGPEGGLTAGETEALVSAGARTVSLGGLVLRVETAAVAACAVVMSATTPCRNSPTATEQLK